VLTSAQAKALGVVSPTAGLDGSIGFGAGSNYTFDHDGHAVGRRSDGAGRDPMGQHRDWIGRRRRAVDD